MAEEQNEAPAQLGFALQRCYLKDASLEMPNSPALLVNPPAEPPKIEIQFEVGQTQVPLENTIEVWVRATVTAKVQESTAFLVECKQGGIFHVEGANDEQMVQIVNVICPNIVYPYLRANVADLLQRTSLPTINLPEVNWELFFQQRLAEAAQQAQAQQQPQAAN